MKKNIQLSDKGFRNTHSRKVVEELAKEAQISQEQARGLVMYHGGLGGLEKSGNIKDLLKFKALKELMSEEEAQRVIDYMKNRKKDKKMKKKLTLKADSTTSPKKKVLNDAAKFIKDIKDVKVGYVGEDYNGDLGKVLKVGTAKSIGGDIDPEELADILDITEEEAEKMPAVSVDIDEEKIDYVYGDDGFMAYLQR